MIDSIIDRFLAMMMEAFNIDDAEDTRNALEEFDIILHKDGGIATILSSAEIVHISELVVRAESRNRGLATEMIQEVIKRDSPKLMCAITAHPAVTAIMDRFGPDITEGPILDLVIAIIRKGDDVGWVEVKGSRVVWRQYYGEKVIQKKRDFELDHELNPGDAFLHIKHIKRLS